MDTLTRHDLLRDPIVYNRWTTYYEGAGLASRFIVGVGVSDTELRDFFHKKEMKKYQNRLKSRQPLSKDACMAQAVTDFKESKKMTLRFETLLHRLRMTPDEVVYHLTCPITGERYNVLKLKDLMKNQEDGTIRSVHAYLTNKWDGRSGRYAPDDTLYHRQFSPLVHALVQNEWGFDGTALVDMSLLKHGDVVADHINEVVVYLETTCALVSKRTYVNSKGRFFKHKFGRTSKNVYLPSPHIVGVEKKLEGLRNGTLPDQTARNLERMAEAGLLHLPKAPDRALYEDLKTLVQAESSGTMSQQDAIKKMRMLLSEYR